MQNCDTYFIASWAGRLLLYVGLCYQLFNLCSFGKRVFFADFVTLHSHLFVERQT